MQNLMRESLACSSFKLEGENIACRFSNSVQTVSRPHEAVLLMLRDWELWPLFGTKMNTQTSPRAHTLTSALCSKVVRSAKQMSQ